MYSIKDLVKYAKMIECRELRESVISILNNPILTISRATPLISIEESPAAPRKHHAYSGGLIQHTISVISIALRLSDVFEEIYGIKLSKDLVIASAILHDIFKFYQYERDEVNGGFRARNDWYLSHDYAIIAELAARKAPEKLIRCLSEIHGNVPLTMLECLVVHLADSIDASFNEHIQNVLMNIARDIENLSRGKYRAYDVFIKLIERGLGKALESIIGTTRSQLLKKLLRELQ